MKTVRTNCFETNSSSTHSITIDSSTPTPFTPFGRRVTAGEFGWEFRKFNDFDTKASYFWTLATNYVSDRPEDTPMRDLAGRLQRIAEKQCFELAPVNDKDWTYVDHGWEHYNTMVSRYPELLTDDGLYAFLVNSNCWIMLGNDNSTAEPNFRLTPYQIENAEKFLVLEDDPTIRLAMVGDEENTEERWAYEAFYCWKEKHMPYRYDSKVYEGWHRVGKVEDGKIHLTVETYNHKEKKSEVLRSYTMNYTIEKNERPNTTACL